MNAATLYNPQLEGDPFLWEAGQTAVMLVHGLTATTAEVRRLGRNLHRAGFTISGPLLPGHGTTPADLNRTGWDDWYVEVENTYVDLSERYERVVVGGESTGALLALLLAARHPKAGGVLAYAPALALRLSRFEKLFLPVMALFLGSRPKPNLTGDTWQGYPVNPLKAVVQLRRLQGVITRALPQVTQPLLIIQGGRDMSIDQRSAEQIYQRVNSKVKELHWLEKSGHCLLLDQGLPQATLLTLNFLYKIR